MPGLWSEELKFTKQKNYHWRFRLWREWCFARTTARGLGWRLILIILLLLGGGMLFHEYEGLSLAKGTYYSWCLAFGEPPEDFPVALPLRIVFFLGPVLGLTVIIEGILNFSFLLRDRRRYERNWCLTMASSMSNHIILVGFGKLGYRAFELLRRLGEPVVVIEREEKTRFIEDLRRDGSPLIIGDARDENLLVQANIAKARSLILATNDDLANLEIALDARRIKPGIRVVCRMFDQNMANKIRDGFNIHLAMSESAMSAPAFAMAAVDPSIVKSFVVNNQLVVMHRWTVRDGGPLANRTAGQITTEWGCSVVEIKRNSDSPRLFPPPDAMIKAHDELLVQGPFETINKLKEKQPHG